MGRQENVLPVGQRVVIQIRELVVEHVQIRIGDLSAVDGVDHILLVDHAAPGAVDKADMAGDLVELRLGDDVLRLLHQRHMHTDIVALPEDGVQIHHGHAVGRGGLLRHIGIKGDDAHAEAGQILRHHLGDTPEAHQAHRLVLQAVDVGEVGGDPVLVDADIVVKGHQALVVGQDARGHVVGHVLHESVRQVCHGDPPLPASLHVDKVPAHALAGDELQVGHGFNDPPRQRLQHVHHGVRGGGGLDDHVLVGTLPALHVEVLQHLSFHIQIAQIEKTHNFFHGIFSFLGRAAERAGAAGPSDCGCPGGLHHPHKQLREVGADQKDDDGCGNEAPDPFDDALEGDLADGGADEQVGAVRRCDEADGQVHGHEDTEVYRVHAVGCHHRQQDRRQNGTAANVVHKHPHHHQEQVDDQQDQDLVLSQGQDEVGHDNGDLLQRQDVGEAGGHAHGEGGGAGYHDGVHHAVLELLPADLLVNEGADDKRIHAGDGGRLGGGEVAGVDAAQDDNGAQQRPERLLEGDPQRPEVEAAAVADPAVFLGYKVVIHQNGDAQQDAGDKARLEQVANGGLRGHAVDHEGDGGRDDDADGAGRSGKRRGVALVVALGLHFGDHERADGGNGGGAGTGDGGEEHGRHRGDSAQTAGKEADDVIRQIQQTSGNAAVAHEVTGQHEEGNGHQGKAVEAGHRALGDHDGVDVGGQYQRQHGGQTQRNTDGKAQTAEEQEQNDQQYQHGQAASFVS